MAFRTHQEVVFDTPEGDVWKFSRQMEGGIAIIRFTVRGPEGTTQPGSADEHTLVMTDREWGEVWSTVRLS